jgi:hypothetical protein
MTASANCLGRPGLTTRLLLFLPLAFGPSRPGRRSLPLLTTKPGAPKAAGRRCSVLVLMLDLNQGDSVTFLAVLGPFHALELPPQRVHVAR